MPDGPLGGGEVGVIGQMDPHIWQFASIFSLLQAPTHCAANEPSEDILRQVASHCMEVTYWQRERHPRQPGSCVVISVLVLERSNQRRSPNRDRQGSTKKILLVTAVGTIVVLYSPHPGPTYW